MKNVKRILTLLVVLAMVFTCVIALAACQPDEEDPNKKPPVGGGGSGDIPTQEGMITLYFTIKNEVEMTSINSYFICGTPNDWTEGNTDYELKRIEGTDTYYVFMDPAIAKGATYKIVIGWNSTSPAPVSQQGPFWASGEGYGPWPGASADSFVPDFEDGAKTVKCTFNCVEKDGKKEREESEVFQFNGCKGDPEKIENFDLRVHFKKGQTTADSKVYILGITDWNVEVGGPNLATRTEGTNVDTYTVHVDEMYGKDIVDYLVVVFPDGLGDTITDAVDDKGNPKTADVWDYYGAERGGIKIYDPTTSNTNISLGSALDGFKVRDGYIDLANSSEDKGLDLTLASDGLLDINADIPMVEVVLTVTFTAAIPDNLKVFLCGSGIGDLAWDGTHPMTANSDRTVFTLTVSARVGAKLEFKVVVGTENAAGATEWPSGVEINTSNATVEVTAEGTLNLFDSAQTYTPAA